VALSSVETEYMAANSASSKAIWLCKLIPLLTDQMLDPTVIYCDNHTLRIQCFMIVPNTSIFSAISSNVTSIVYANLSPGSRIQFIGNIRENIRNYWET
jgi:hypothetical protein